VADAEGRFKKMASGGVMSRTQFKMLAKELLKAHAADAPAPSNQVGTLSKP